MSADAAGGEALRRYYSLHARIYDTTRWSFLFGRSAILDLAVAGGPPRRILEIGCGTGVNLRRLAREFPLAELTGLDGSADMLRVARRNLAAVGHRLTLREGFYTGPLRPTPAPDLILFSYCLTMIHPGWEQVIEAAVGDLAPGGRLAVVDFHGSDAAWFRRWMGVNHVRMERDLLPKLKATCRPEVAEVRPAYAGWWEYLLFIGIKAAGV
ncbi:MAG: class I SAM-dependent methyltransferase [Limisphaerales bacterium]